MENRLPSGWVHCSLGDVCSKPQYGWTSKAGKSGKIKYLRTTDISDGSVNWNTVPYCVELPPDINKFQVRKDDILVSRAGSVGYNFRIKDDVPFPAVFASYLIRFKAHDSITAQYIDYFLKSKEYWNQISDFAAGIAIPNVNASKLEELILPLPPLAEQRRIVTKLDAVMAKVEANKRRLDKIPQLLKRFRQSVLAAAVSGKLTEEWRAKSRHAQRASNLIEEIKAEIDKQVKLKHRKRQEQFSVIEEQEKICELPENWEWVRLGEISQLINGDRGLNYPNVKEYVSVGVPWINTGHIEPDGTLSADRMNYITKEKFKSLNSGKIVRDDIVYCLRGATLGKTAIVEYDEGAVASSLVIIRNESKINPRLIYYVLISPYGKDLISRFDNGTAQPNLSANSVKLYPIPLPPEVEQIEIVKKVEQLFAFADKLEARYIKAKAMLDKLPQSILAKTFRGELVEQDPEDEPAGVLLGRIRTEKEDKSEKKSKKSKKSYSPALTARQS